MWFCIRLFPDLYYLFLRKEFSRLNPALVVIGIFPENDLSDIQYNEWLDGNLEILKIKCPKFYVDTNRRLRYGSEYGLGGNFFSGKAGYLSKIKIAIRDNVYLFNFILSKIRMINFNKGNKFDLKIPEARLSPSFVRKRFETAVSKIKTFLEESKVPYLFILIPSKQDFISPSDELVYIDNYMKENKFNYLNLLPEFKSQNADVNKIYFRYDGHWNSYGHYMAGVALCSYFKRADLFLKHIYENAPLNDNRKQ